MSYIKEIKELVHEIKKSEEVFEGGENSIDDEEKNKERLIHVSRSNEEGEELLKP